MESTSRNNHEVEEGYEDGYRRGKYENGNQNLLAQSKSYDNFDLQGSASSDGSHSDYDDDFDIAPGKDDISLMSSDDDGSIELGYDNGTTVAINAVLKERKPRSGSFDSASNNKRKHEKIAKLSDSAKLLAKEKNREHAKNTRMRKKNYIESLKETVKQLSDEREKIERDRNIVISKLMEQVKYLKLYTIRSC